ncbi:MAG: exodeoxyribonuclease V subunit alpha [Actinomycetota bacterium]|nr:exodeoxyribonuclease V subunit alpha [Actinomycetota bacterium]
MTAASPAADRDTWDVGRVRSATGLLWPFNDAGVLGPADVHVATTLGRLCGEGEPAVLLAAALAVRAPRLGHVCADLDTVRHTVTVDEDAPVGLRALPWPSPRDWVEAVATSALTAEGDPPLRLVGSRLYLDRYWRYERRVVEDLQARAGAADGHVDVALLRRGLDRLLPSSPRPPDLQRLAAAAAVLRRFTVIAGGPGTGKTTTVARILALLQDQADGTRVALAAPTGKAATRLTEAVRTAAAADEITGPAARLEASTLHRLLGARRGETRFRHDRANPLPHDAVVVDETSMVSLALMSKLFDAVRPDARVVLLGDPEQLTSVEAGAVLGDMVGPARAGLRMCEASRRQLGEVTGQAVPATDPPAGSAVGDGIVVLRRVHRFREESGIAELAAAVQAGDADDVLALLEAGRPDLTWVEGPADDEPARHRVSDRVVASVGHVLEAARVGAADDALEALGALRLLCAHRRGPFGVATWVSAIERRCAERLDHFDTTRPWYVGRPVLVTRNDYQLGVFNGDVGVVVARPDGEVEVAFPAAAGRVTRVSPTRLEAIETVHAMTVHKSQGSQFREVVVVLPGPDSPILTRELLYTAVTRASEALTLVGGADAVRAAVARPIQRASGLREALWT